MGTASANAFSGSSPLSPCFRLRQIGSFALYQFTEGELCESVHRSNQVVHYLSKEGSRGRGSWNKWYELSIVDHNTVIVACPASFTMTRFQSHQTNTSTAIQPLTSTWLQPSAVFEAKEGKEIGAISSHWLLGLPRQRGAACP